nr:hypothetical protein fc1 [uncultured bacterium]
MVGGQCPPYSWLRPSTPAGTGTATACCRGQPGGQRVAACDLVRVLRPAGNPGRPVGYSGSQRGTREEGSGVSRPAPGTVGLARPPVPARNCDSASGSFEPPPLMRYKTWLPVGRRGCFVGGWVGYFVPASSDGMLRAWLRGRRVWPRSVLIALSSCMIARADCSTTRPS